jgi:hypothetical protein
MRTRRVRAAVAGAIVLGLAASTAEVPAASGAGSAVICKRKAKLTLRENACKKKETRIESAQLGTARWALVDASGTILAQSGGITVASAEAGFYVLDFGSSQTGRGVQATTTLTAADQTFRGVAVAGLCGGSQAPLDICPPGFATDHHVYVATTSTTNGAQEAHAFYVVSF